MTATASFVHRKVLATIACSMSLSSGCGELEREPTGEEGAAVATFLVELDASESCNEVGLIELQVRARRVGCGDVQGCEQRPVEVLGTRVTCPSTASETLMGVDVEAPGIYQVDILARFTTGEEEPRCLRTPDGDAELAVTRQALQDSAEFVLEPTDEPCPP